MRRSASTKEALHRSLARPPARPTVDGGWDDNDARRREARERLAEHRLLRPERDAAGVAGDKGPHRRGDGRARLPSERHGTRAREPPQPDAGADLPGDGERHRREDQRQRPAAAARERLAEHRLLRPERDAREPRDVVHRCHLSLRRLAVVRAIGATPFLSKRFVEALRRIASIQRTNRYGQGAHITKWYRSDIAGYATETPTARSDTAGPVTARCARA